MISQKRTQIEISDIDCKKISLSPLTSPQGEFQWRKATLKYDEKPFIVKSFMTRSTSGIQRFQGSKMSMYICMNPDNEWVKERRALHGGKYQTDAEEEAENKSLKDVEKQVRHLLNKQVGKKSPEHVKLLRPGKDDESLSIYCELREGITCLKMKEGCEMTGGYDDLILPTKTHWEQMMGQHLLLNKFSLVLNHVSLSKGNPPVIKATLGVAEVEPFVSHDFSDDFLELDGGED